MNRRTAEATTSPMLGFLRPDRLLHPPQDQIHNTVLIIEDHPPTGSLLFDYLHGFHIRRLVARRVDTIFEAAGLEVDDDMVDPDGGRYEGARFEPAAGHLSQLRHFISEDNSPDPFGVVVPQRARFPVDYLPDLGEAAAHDDLPRRRAALEDCIRKWIEPKGVRINFRNLVMVVDLALLKHEGPQMVDAGGLPTAPVPLAKRRSIRRLRRPPASATPHQVTDPRDVLRTITGFRIIEAFRQIDDAHLSVPVIATTHLGNPLIAQHCLVNGAFGVVRKPLPHVDKNPVDPDNPMDMCSACERKIAALERRAKEYSSDTPKQLVDALVVNYAMSVIAEVLKAIGSVERRIDGDPPEAPSPASR